MKRRINDESGEGSEDSSNPIAQKIATMQNLIQSQVEPLPPADEV